MYIDAVDCAALLQPVPAKLRTTLYAPVAAVGLNNGEVDDEPVVAVMPGPDHVYTEVPAQPATTLAVSVRLLPAQNSVAVEAVSEPIEGCALAV